MEVFSPLGKVLVILGVVLVLLGLLLAGKLPFLGKLPGDIRIEREHYVVYIPITSMLIISAILSLILSLWRR